MRHLLGNQISRVVTLVIVSLIASVSGMFHVPPASSQGVDIDSCGTMIDVPGTRAQLVQNLTNCEVDAITITADDVVLDLNGFVVDGVCPESTVVDCGQGPTGIKIDARNVKVEGPGVVKEFDIGIQVRGTFNKVEGATIYDNDKGVELSAASDSTVEKNHIVANLIGVRPTAGSTRNEISHNTMLLNAQGVWFFQAGNNANEVTNNVIGISRAFSGFSGFGTLAPNAYEGVRIDAGNGANEIIRNTFFNVLPFVGDGVDANVTAPNDVLP